MRSALCKKIVIHTRETRRANEMGVQLYKRLLHHASDETRDIIEDIGAMLAMLREE